MYVGELLIADNRSQIRELGACVSPSLRIEVVVRQFERISAASLRIRSLFCHESRMLVTGLKITVNFRWKRCAD
jgi:hypothetical protein